jgi:hypothetical protein
VRLEEGGRKACSLRGWNPAKLDREGLPESDPTVNEYIAVREHPGDRNGSDEVTEQHCGVRQEAALMRMARGDGQKYVEEHLQGQDESEDPDARATLLCHQGAEGQGEGEQQGQEGRLREFSVAARMAEERDQDRGHTQGCSAH